MIIFTGRFQPFHLGHIELINTLLKEYPDETICLGIIRDCHIENSNDPFDKKADTQLSIEKNPYSAEVVLRMAQEIVKITDSRRVVYSLMPRTSLHTWRLINDIFGDENNRKWVIPIAEGVAGEWEEAKAKLYLQLGEEVIRIHINKTINATEVRELIQERNIEQLQKVIPGSILDILM